MNRLRAGQQTYRRKTETETETEIVHRMAAIKAGRFSAHPLLPAGSIKYDTLKLKVHLRRSEIGLEFKFYAYFKFSMC